MDKEGIYNGICPSAGRVEEADGGKVCGVEEAEAKVCGVEEPDGGKVCGDAEAAAATEARISIFKNGFLGSPLSFLPKAPKRDKGSLLFLCGSDEIRAKLKA
ncbi:MAG: hypothetical protein ACLQU1_17105 [Bryobacteraceae bacterium]